MNNGVKGMRVKRGLRELLSRAITFTMRITMLREKTIDQTHFEPKYISSLPPQPGLPQQCRRKPLDPTFAITST